MFTFRLIEILLAIIRSVGTLNLNDDSILGYDMYSSALAEILSEPSLPTPITVVNKIPF